jgi:NADH:ubiquinone oxidoreductase subunit 6 (subunit J)
VNIAVLELVVMSIAVAGLVLWVWALIDVLKRPKGEWERTGQSQMLWLIVLVLLNVLGAVAYLVTAGSRRNRGDEVAST